MGSFFFQKAVAMVWVPLFVFVVMGVMYVVVSGYETPKEDEKEGERAVFDIREIFIIEDFPMVC